MDIKKAIEFLENRHKYRLYRNSAYDVSIFNDAIDKLIEACKCVFKDRPMRNW